MKNIDKIRPFTKMCCTIGNLPSSYMMSMTYEEQLLWLCNFLEKTVIPSLNEDSEAIIEIQNQFNLLKEYVEDYLENLDIQEDVDNKLDEMALDGTLENLINQELFTELNTKVNNKVNIYNQESRLSRLFRIITTYTKVGAIHEFNNSIYYSMNDGSNSILYKLNKTTYEVQSTATFDYVITDITNYENNLIIFNNTTSIYSLDKDTLLSIDSITTEFNLKYCEYNESESKYYLVDDNNDFLTTEDFTTISDYNFNQECNAIAFKNGEMYLLQDNELYLYKNKNIERIYNNEIVVNNAYYKGQNGAICTNGNNFILATYKLLLVHRSDYIISFYDMNLTDNVKVITKLLDYNATTNDFEIHVNTANTNVNPDGSHTNAFPNIYEAMEVVLNGNYHKGSIIFDSSNDELENILITSINKKISIVFNGATIKGMRVRNCTKVELSGADFQDEYEDQETCLQIINSDVVIASNCTFTNTKSLNQVLKAEYKSYVVCLVGTGNLGLYSDSGAILVTRNNSLYDKKILGDRFGKFLPNFIIDSNTNLSVGTPVTIPNLSWYSKIMFRINLQLNFSFLEIPALDGTYNLTSCATVEGKVYVGNLNITISGNTLTVNSRTLYNLTDGALDTTLTFRINNIFLES